ncbi:hypothetical protein HF325_001972 [Metschnikowia pulcherrima]|uniref:Histone-binding protein RBBP4-like N-terminal domain-containing protein n=1 Tax=Metschnikowia pulcherrima TaxID=27326 RepID=A0A8H7GVK5_9ASCO|nr:hypothetical protein HF325_001972 [Metschnikowia pulcherrima]
MGKRSAEEEIPVTRSALKTDADSVPLLKDHIDNEQDVEMGEFEDPYGDDFESEEEIIELDSAGEEDEGMEEEAAPGKIEEVDEKKTQQQAAESTLYLPHRSKPLGPDEVLEADPTVYEMLHNVNMPWPCLTLDIMPDNLGSERRNYPASYLTALLQENGEVQIFDLAAQFKAFDTPGFTIPKPSKKPIHTVRVHGNVEGYGLDWSPLINTGSLLTGDCLGRIHLTLRTTSSWVTDKTPFTASNDSIEDIQWSTGESTVFASAGCDGYVRIWDTRSKKHKPVISVAASKTDVNVISWSDKINHLLASGHDDGSWGVWDLRNFGGKEQPAPVAHYDFHKSAITSISFNPLDESIIAVSSEDNTVTLWDLAVEADDEEIAQQRKETQELSDIPPQLLFVHWQRDVKDVRWHRQIPGCLVSTGGDGLNIWKTISV